MSVFLDTNVLVYLFDADAPEKQALARATFERLVLEGQVLLSTQVLQELYVTVTRKLAVPLGFDEALEVVRELAQLPMVQVDGPMVLKAIQLSQRYGFSFWDALIVQAALAGGAELLLTEDLQHGQLIAGLRIENPFQNH